MTTSLLTVGDTTYRYYPVASLPGAETLPYSLRVLAENVLRHHPDDEGKEQAARICEAASAKTAGREIDFSPARVLFQDFTGVPVFVDFAAMRDAATELGGSAAAINPGIPCDLVIDHSIIADAAGAVGCAQANERLEYERNEERYEFLKWAQGAFSNVRIVPPGKGICHQLNIESFATVVASDEPSDGNPPLAYFDTVVGTDSHTPTVNGLSVLGWGVGGIEAEAAALGQPITTLVPPVVAVRLSGSLQPGVRAMDVALTFAQKLRAHGVVGCFVECIGEGVSALSATQRATIANMSPEYGCTCTLFPVDEQTLAYLRVTGRDEARIALVEAYAKAQGLWNDPQAERDYSAIIDIDLSAVTPMVAGPARPHDGVARSEAKDHFEAVCAERNVSGEIRDVLIDGLQTPLSNGAIAIAAITSCTTATDAEMMLAAGLVARNAARRGVKAKPWVKTILAPGSHVTELLLRRAGLDEALNAVGFHLCGFGCMSCIGNSGPILPELSQVSDEIELASVLSGNRNFEGRISPDVSQNYLMAPESVVAYALAGTMAVDFDDDVLALDEDGLPVHWSDIAPDEAELEALKARLVTKELYTTALAGLVDGDEQWQALAQASGERFHWDEDSTYIRKPPYFDGMSRETPEAEPLPALSVLGLFGDFITTDHISPAGGGGPESPAARYLESHGVAPADFNTYGSRRGNHEVLMRGTFANVKLQNQLAAGRRGGWTRGPDGAIETIYDAARAYEAKDRGLIILAGKLYGSGSSRDWAAKGPKLLGVRAVIAESFERIHRSNLIGMGILPLQLVEGDTIATIGLTGDESFAIEPIEWNGGLPKTPTIGVEATRDDGTLVRFEAIVRIDTPTEGCYYLDNGILPYVLRSLMSGHERANPQV